MHVDSMQNEFDNEDMMIEMEKTLYEELKRELVKRGDITTVFQILI